MCGFCMILHGCTYTDCRYTYNIQLIYLNIMIHMYRYVYIYFYIQIAHYIPAFGYCESNGDCTCLPGSVNWELEPKLCLRSWKRLSLESCLVLVFHEWSCKSEIPMFGWVKLMATLDYSWGSFQQIHIVWIDSGSFDFLFSLLFEIRDRSELYDFSI